MILAGSKTKIAHKAPETDRVLRLLVVADATKGGGTAFFEEVLEP